MGAVVDAPVTKPTRHGVRTRSRAHLAVPLLGETQVAEEFGVHLWGEGDGGRHIRECCCSAHILQLSSTTRVAKRGTRAAVRSNAASADRSGAMSRYNEHGPDTSSRTGIQIQGPYTAGAPAACAHPLEWAPLLFAERHGLLDAIPVVLVRLVVRGVVGRLGHGCAAHAHARRQMSSQPRGAGRPHSRGRQPELATMAHARAPSHSDGTAGHHAWIHPACQHQASQGRLCTQKHTFATCCLTSALFYLDVHTCPPLFSHPIFCLSFFLSGVACVRSCALSPRGSAHLVVLGKSRASRLSVSLPALLHTGS